MTIDKSFKRDTYTSLAFIAFSFLLRTCIFLMSSSEDHKKNVIAFWKKYKAHQSHTAGFIAFNESINYTNRIVLSVT